MLLTVQFILGPAGSGKSSYVMGTVADTLRKQPRKKIILMVPEQGTFTYQYELINAYGLSGVLTLEILSFQRLARTVMQQTGGLAYQHLDDLGKLLILRRLLQEHQEQYEFLNSSVDRSGYLMKIGQMLQELKRYQISSEQLERTVAQCQLPKTTFACKLEELSRLYLQYEAFLVQDYLDSEDVLELLLKRLEERELFRDVEFWVDEFYDFTPQEYAILGALMQQTDVHIVLPADPEHAELGRQTAFYSTGKTLARLRQMAAERNVEQREDRCMRPVRWQQAADLAFLEQHYFSIGNTLWQEKPEHLRLLCGQNRMSEVDAAARLIRQLCREQGYRYGEIGIFTRGDQYELLLETVLTDYEIPYFVDHKEAMRQHPLTELILAAFDILKNNWSYQGMFRFLKTALLPYGQQELDLLENYVLQYGIRGSAWYREEDWQYGNGNGELLEQLNALRRQIAGPLRRFQLALAQPQPADGFIQAIYTLLDEYVVPQQLSRLCQEANDHGLLESIQLHQQIWDHVIQIFDQMSQLLQDTLLTAGEFAVILQSAFDNLDLGLLPNSLDQVLIGALAHSRSCKLQVAFVLGLNEGVFPAKVTQDGFFNDGEKQALREMGIQLSPDSGEQLYEEQLLIYLALTRASQELILSYSLSDEDGKALRPSGIVERLRRLYPLLQEEAVQWPPAEGQEVLPYLNHSEKAMGLLGAHLRKPENEETQEIWAELYNWFVDHPTALFDSVCDSLKHEEQLAARTLHSTEIYGEPLRLSVSALEKYRLCPYNYFLTYGLRLKERQFYQMEAVDVGQFYHAAIERFSNYLLERQISWQGLDSGQVKDIMAMIVEQLAPEMQNEILLSTGRYRYLRRRLQKTLERSALMLLEHGRRGDFVPIALEADFGMAQSKLPAWRLTLKDGSSLLLQGRIDRIEQAEEDGIHYLRVIDFKTGSQGLRLTDIYYGLKIQLLSYLQVALQYYERLLPQGERVLPAGVLYYFFRSSVLSADGPLSVEKAKELHDKEVKAQGLLVADMKALKLAQRDLTTGSSTLLPLSLLKDAAPYMEDAEAFAQLEDPLALFGKRNNTVVTREQLELLLQHTKQIIVQLGQQIHQGDIAVRPCRIGQFTGCQYCGYQTICQIQTVNESAYWEELPLLERDEIWARLEQEKGEKKDADMDERTAASH